MIRGNGWEPRKRTFEAMETTSSRRSQNRLKRPTMASSYTFLENKRHLLYVFFLILFGHLDILATSFEFVRLQHAEAVHFYRERSIQHFGFDFILSVIS